MTYNINYRGGAAYGDQFPDDAPVLVRYPLPGADPMDRSTWAWLPGSILSQCGPDEWSVLVEVPAPAIPDPSVSNSDAPENMLYPTCFRDASELRPATAAEWERACAEVDCG
ncbi:hypothetical protein Aple_103640 [Acrocarpospora pleiomorpha]|uniref:Uncharacterized protein n=1 Tax=Acrocarpospora pleiomorpha TaxID=90975 RepID=A0A5M3Y2D0_9ACTN|nr:hypothetical protein [Acrocarpospora pleiomorpha]GES27464.1 hypothetical protein Aple_103640 [Acrocarpospora pleiomorpha]